jgi:hypothetical protein
MTSPMVSQTEEIPMLWIRSADSLEGELSDRVRRTRKLR